MAKKRDLTEEEKRIWQEAMRDVTPLENIPEFSEEPARPAPKILKKSYVKTAAKLLPATPKPATLSTIDTATQKRVSGGEYTPAAKLDLHGFTLERAYDVLNQFIASHYAKGSRCVLVITGKGGKSGQKGILQQDVPHWLSHSNMSRMVAFHTTAQARHGGAGALYVLLKRKR